MAFSYKTIDNSVVDVDDKSRRVKVAISEMGSVDLDNDIIDQNAYTKTIAERGPAAKNKIYHLTDHTPNLKNALGKFKELYVEGNKLIGVTDIVKTTWGNDVLEMYKAGTITEHSIGFSTIKAEEGKSPDDPRILKELRLFEGSAILWGSNENTPTLSVGKSYTKRQKADELNRIIRELAIIGSFYKNGNYSDDAAVMIEIRMLQLEESIKALFAISLNNPSHTTTAAIDIDAQEPDEEELYPLIDTSGLSQARGGTYGRGSVQRPAIQDILGVGKSGKPALTFAEQLLLSTL